MRTGLSRQFFPLASGRQVIRDTPVQPTSIKACWTQKPSTRSKPINCSIRSIMPLLMPGSACFTARWPGPGQRRSRTRKTGGGTGAGIQFRPARITTAVLSMRWRARSNRFTNCSTAHSSVVWPSIIPEPEKMTWNSAGMDTINLSMVPALWLIWSRPCRTLPQPQSKYLQSLFDAIRNFEHSRIYSLISGPVYLVGGKVQDTRRETALICLFRASGHP